MAFQPSDTLKSRTYIGLIVAQFLAAFNDQAIHASAMFYAIRQNTLTEDKAISLMPILFFAPWAIFATLAGYLSDRYSKRTTLVFWKFAEIGITFIALAGFWLGTTQENPVGPWIVLVTVFLMGLHSAFFVPAKYGAMPEILQPHLLSKGNGVLESTSFLAAILGTVSGGILSEVFEAQEYYIGLILLGLAIIGAVASLLIQKMPAANPTRPFPTNLLKPLFENLRTMIRSRPLALSLLGIAFFTFMVAFMRATMYMHGESQSPRWSEFKTSLVVATVALGVGLGSPLAGWFSGGKVELGLVPFGAIGIIISAFVAALLLADTTALIVCLILIGFFSGFYIVPLYTLLQHRAPKRSKGDLIATSNFINVTGAIAASLLFFVLVLVAKWAGVARSIPQTDVATGVLLQLEPEQTPLHPDFIEIETEDGDLFRIGQPPKHGKPLTPEEIRARRRLAIEVDKGLEVGSSVTVSRWNQQPRKVTHYEVRDHVEPLEDAYDKEDVPRFLFVGAGLMTLGILILLCRQLPDFFVRTLVWLRAIGHYQMKIVGMHNMPNEGAIVLVTNTGTFEEGMQLVSATDRCLRFVLPPALLHAAPVSILLRLARRVSLIELPGEGATAEASELAVQKAVQSLSRGHLVGLMLAEDRVADVDRFLDELRKRISATILPVYRAEPGHLVRTTRRVRVVIGHPMKAEATAAEIRKALATLGEWLDGVEKQGGTPTTVLIPEV